MTNLTPAELIAVSNGGLYNGNRYDQSSNPFGYAGKGYLTLFPQSMNDAATMLNAADRLTTQTSNAAAAAAAIVASRPKATSTTSNTIAATGSLTFATNENLLTAQPFYVTDFVKVSSTVDPTNFVFGIVTAVTANSLTVALSTSGGSGTFSSWVIVGSGAQGAANGIANVAADTMPALGGDLSTNGHKIAVGAGDQIALAANSGGIEMNGAVVADAVLQNYLELRQANPAAINNVTLDPTAGTHAHLTMSGNLNLLPPALAVPAGKVCTMIVEVTAPSSNAYTLSFDAGFNTIGTVGGSIAAGTTSKFRVESDVKQSDGTTVYWKLYQVEAGRVLA